MAERVDWVEIREPRSGDLMYANIKTGECLWEAPKSANVKKTSSNQWWELYDEKTRRYYYYNAHTKQTEWRKPKESDIITLAKLQNLKGRGSKRRSSSSRKDGSQRRRSASRKESSESRGIRDGEQSLPRKYSRHNSGESLSHARKNSRSSHTRTSRDDQGTEQDTKGEEVTMQDNTIDEMRDDEQVQFTFGEHLFSGKDKGADMPDVQELNHSNRSSEISMDLETNMDTTTRNIEYLKISCGIADDVENDTDDAEVLETSFGTLIPPPETSSGRTSNCSVTHQSNYVSDGPLSESETSTHNDSFHSCDSKVGESNTELELIVTAASPPREDGELLTPEDIPRTTSFFNKMVDNHGNLKTFSPEERSNFKRCSSERRSNAPLLDAPVLRGEGGRRRSSSFDPKAYDNLPSSPHHYSTYDNLKSDNSSDEDSVSLSDKLISGGMPCTTATLVEDCEPMESLSNDESHDRNSRTYQHQVSDSVLEVGNGKLSKRPDRTPPPAPRNATKLIVRSNTCPVPNRCPESPITPPPRATPVFTQPSLSVQHRGIFGKKDNFMDNMLTHSKQPIKKPVLTTRDKQLKKEAVEMFKLVLFYMGDKTNRNKKTEDALWEIVTKAWAYQPMRDELYFQLVKQTTDNSSSASLEKGWELMAVCLAMFPPSAKYHSYLEGYVYSHLKDNQPVHKILEQEITNRIAQYAENCHYKLEKMAKTGSRKGQRQPTQEEVRAAKRAIFNPSMFGSTLEDTMEMQRLKYPDHKLPWILTCLTERIIHYNGTSTEGIFRVPGDIDEVNALKVKTDSWKYPDDCNDPNVAASLLKQWFRDLKDPLLDESVYERCVSNCEDETISSSIVTSLPNINRLVLCFIIRFLQIFCKSEVIRVTKMDVNNLAMVWAPNFLRCPSNDPKIIFENTRKEMTFVRTLLNNFDTAFMEGVK